ELWASIICDGHHLPPAVARCIVRVKSPARTILTCDASSLAGLPPGRYRQWDQELEVVPDGKVIVPGSGFLAGSWAFTGECVDRILQYTDVRLRDALAMAGVRRRSLLSSPLRSLEPGQPGDVILFDWSPGRKFELRASVVAGKLVG